MLQSVVTSMWRGGAKCIYGQLNRSVNCFLRPILNTKEIFHGLLMLRSAPFARRFCVYLAWTMRRSTSENAIRARIIGDSTGAASDRAKCTCSSKAVLQPTMSCRFYLRQPRICRSRRFNAAHDGHRVPDLSLIRSITEK